MKCLCSKLVRIVFHSMCRVLQLQIRYEQKRTSCVTKQYISSPNDLLKINPPRLHLTHHLHLGRTVGPHLPPAAANSAVQKRMAHVQQSVYWDRPKPT